MGRKEKVYKKGQKMLNFPRKNPLTGKKFQI